MRWKNASNLQLIETVDTFSHKLYRMYNTEYIVYTEIFIISKLGPFQACSEKQA